MCSGLEKEVFHSEALSIKMKSRGSVFQAMKFCLSEFGKKVVAEVVVHLYPSTTSLMVQGSSGLILGNKPFLCFADVLLEPLFAGEVVIVNKYNDEGGEWHEMSNKAAHLGVVSSRVDDEGCEIGLEHEVFTGVTLEESGLGFAEESEREVNPDGRGVVFHEGGVENRESVIKPRAPSAGLQYSPLSALEPFSNSLDLCQGAGFSLCLCLWKYF